MGGSSFLINGGVAIQLLVMMFGLVVDGATITSDENIGRRGG